MSEKESEGGGGGGDRQTPRQTDSKSEKNVSRFAPHLLGDLSR